MIVNRRKNQLVIKFLKLLLTLTQRWSQRSRGWEELGWLCYEEAESQKKKWQLSWPESWGRTLKVTNWCLRGREEEWYGCRTAVHRRITVLLLNKHFGDTVLHQQPGSWTIQRSSSHHSTSLSGWPVLASTQRANKFPAVFATCQVICHICEAWTAHGRIMTHGGKQLKIRPALLCCCQQNIPVSVSSLNDFFCLSDDSSMFHQISETLNNTEISTVPK